MPAALRGDRAVERRHHLADDRVVRTGPLIRGAGDRAGVLDPVDRGGEERVRRHVVDHHEVVLRMARERRDVRVLLERRRAGVLTQNAHHAGVSRDGGRGYTCVLQEPPARELALRVTHVDRAIVLALATTGRIFRHRPATSSGWRRAPRSVPSAMWYRSKGSQVGASPPPVVSHIGSANNASVLLGARAKLSTVRIAAEQAPPAAYAPAARSRTAELRRHCCQ